MSVEFLLHDSVVIRNHHSHNGRRGIIALITPDSPPPFQVAFAGEDISPWFMEEQLMLACDCNVTIGGCVCGAAKREREGIRPS